jgi:hypothetical protein
MLQRILSILGLSGPAISVVPVQVDEIRGLLQRVAKREARLNGPRSR